MKHTHALPGAVNVRVVIILVTILALVGGGGAAWYKVRKRVVADRALREGLAALEAGEYATACRHLRHYLVRYPDDPDILSRFADANLKVQPPEPAHLGDAISAYRRLLRMQRGNKVFSARLARLCFRVRNFSEAAMVCRNRLVVAPDDADALLWLGKSRAAQRKREEATAALTELVDKVPDQVEAWILLSDLALATDAPEGRTSALEWLGRALEHQPDVADVWAHRARLLRTVHHDESAARQDLEAADARPAARVTTPLVLAEEWLRLGEPGRAERQLAALRNEGIPNVLEQNPADLWLAWYTLMGDVLLRTQARDRGAALADEALASLSDPHRVVFLPTAVDLYLAANRLHEARRGAEDYARALAGPAGSGATDAGATHLRAAIARAEGRLYDAIAELELLTTRNPRDESAWRHLAEAYDATGQQTRAIDARRQVLTMAPHDYPSVIYLTRAHLNREPAEALKYARMAQQLRPDDLRACLLRIEAQLQTWRPAGGAAGELELLERELQALREESPTHVGIRVLLSRIAALTGKPDAAVTLLEEAIEHCPSAELAGLELARVHQQAGRSDKAIEACRRVIELTPDSALPRLLLAELQVSEGTPEEAIQTLQAAAAALPDADRVELQLALARLQREHGDPDAGQAILESLCDAYPRDAYFRLELLQFPSVRADAEHARAVLEQLRAIEGDQGVQWRLEHASLSMEAPDWQAQSAEIRQLLSECVRTDPTWAPPVLLLGELYERLGEAGEAEALYRRAVDMTSANVDVVARLVQLLQQQQRYPEAETVLRRLPADLRILDDQRLAVTVGLGAHEAAIREVQRRIEREPEHAPNYAFQARLVYAVRGDVDEALRLLDRAETLDPALFATVRSRAQILFAAGRLNEVQALLDQQVAQRNDFAAYELRAGFRVARGDLEAAESDYRTLCNLPGMQAAGYAALGRFHASLGRQDQAVAAWRAGLQQAPQDVGLRKLLIQALLFDPQASAREEGDAMLDEAMAQAPDDMDLLMFQAQRLAAKGTEEATEEAESLYQRILTKDAYHVGAHLAMIELARQRADYPQARERFTRALGARPRCTELLVAGAWIEADRGNPATARDMVGPILRLDPQNVAARSLMARLALAEGDLDRSEHFTQEALALAPAHEASRQIEAQILVARGRLPEAIKRLETIRQTQPAACGPGTLVMLADLYRLLGDAAKAESALHEAEQRAPEQTSVFLARQRLLASMGRFDEVLANLRLHGERHPRDVSALAEAALMLAAAPDHRHAESAVDILKQLTAQAPDQATAFRALGLTLRHTGDTAAAEEAFRQVLRLEPYHRQTLNDLAWLLGVDRGMADEGLELADRGLARYPADPHLLDTRGVLLLRIGRTADAIQTLEASTRATGAPAGTQARTRIHLAQAHLQLGDGPAARLQLLDAHAIDEREGVLTAEEREEVARLMDSAGVGQVPDPGDPHVPAD